MKHYKAVVYICRAQPPHKAHIQTILEACRISDRVIVVLGSAHKPRTPKNPFLSKERESLIIRCLCEEWGITDTYAYHNNLSKIKFVHARDYLYSDTRWAAEIYSKSVSVGGATQNKTTCLIGAHKDESSFYLKMFPQWDFYAIPVLKHMGEVLNATDIRKAVFEDRDLGNYSAAINKCVRDTLNTWIGNSPDGEYVRKEHQYILDNQKLWGDLKYHVAHNAADAVVIKSAHVLLIKRGHHPGKGLYALPGGFVDKETIRDAAIRELKEETKIKIDKPVLERSIVAEHRFDHPKRSERWHIISHAFLFDLGEGPLPEVAKPKNKEASEVLWVPLSDVRSLEDQMFEDHIYIIEKMTSKF